MYCEIEGFPKYRVGSDGSVWSCWSGRWKRLRLTLGEGYLCVALYAGGKPNRVRRQFRVHTLVLSAFRGACPDGMECRHLNGVKTDNRLDNVRWGTRLEQAADRSRHGTHRRGEDSPRAKLTEDGAREVLWLFENVTCNRTEIARRLGVSRMAVTRILNGESWAHLTA